MVNKEKKLRIWSKAVDFITVIWLLHFILELSTSLISNSYSTFFSYFIYTFFIIDLLIIFKNHNSKKQFFKENWFDILMVLPLFRLFRFLKILKIKKLRNLWKLMKKSKKLKRSKKIVSESFDLGRQIKDNVSR